MIFVDSNIPMYLIGADHPNKRECITLLEGYVARQERLVTNTEVFQEIMHRYTALRRKDAIQPAFDTLYRLVDEVFSIEPRDIEAAKNLLLAYTAVSARDALHAASMRSHQVTTILSFDHGFDQLPDLTRVPSK